jgi:hypothetical protein
MAVLVCLAGALPILVPWADAPTVQTRPTPAGGGYGRVFGVATLFGFRTWEAPAVAVALLVGLALSLTIRRVSPRSRMEPAVLAAAGLLALAVAAWGVIDDHGDFFLSDLTTGLLVDLPSRREGGYVAVAAAAALTLLGAWGLIGASVRRRRRAPVATRAPLG